MHVVYTQSNPNCFKQSVAAVWVWGVSNLNPTVKSQSAAIEAQDDLEHVLVRLRTSEKDVENRVTQLTHTLQNKKRDIQSKVGSAVVAANKAKVFAPIIPLINQLKQLRSQQLVNTNRITLVVKQLEAFENGKFQQSIVRTLKQSVIAMKQIGIGNKAEEIDEIMSELDESLLSAQEVNEVLSGTNMLSMTNSMNGDDDIMKELDEWLANDEDEINFNVMDVVAKTDTASKQTHALVTPSTTFRHTELDASKPNESEPNESEPNKPEPSESKPGIALESYPRIAA